MELMHIQCDKEIMQLILMLQRLNIHMNVDFIYSEVFYLPLFIIEQIIKTRFLLFISETTLYKEKCIVVSTPFFQ